MLEGLENADWNGPRTSGGGRIAENLKKIKQEIAERLKEMIK